MKKLLTFLAAMFIAVGYVNADEFKIGIKEAKPFAYQEDGEWKGLSVDLLNQLSKNEKFTYKLYDMGTVPELIKATQDGSVDMSIAAISLTPEREKTIDFSHSYFSTSMGILSHSKASGLEMAWWIAKKIIVIFLIFVGGLYVIGFIMDKVDGDDNIVGVNDGAWWALVTFTTTGYGDLVPKTQKGKLVAAGWMVASLFLISVFTGYVASSMTVKKLSETNTTLADLYDEKVMVVKGTTAEFKLADLGIEYDLATSLDEAVKNFKAGKIDAIVYDKAMLDYVSKDFDNVDAWSIDNSDEYYAIAMPPESAYVEKINLGILKVLSTSKWKAAKANYFGAE